MVEPVYPSPCAPSYEKPTSVEDCLPEAERLVEQEYGRAALGPVADDDRVLIVTLPDQNEYVREAVARVLRDRGATRVDFLSSAELVDGDLDRYSAAEGWREAAMLVDGKASTSLTNADLATGVINDELIDYIDDHPEYTSVYTDIGARTQKRDAFGERFRGNWLFNNWEEFVSGVWTFPGALLERIERNAIRLLNRASKVRITDPEGTHLEVDIAHEEAERWRRGALVPGHLYLDTYGATILDEADPVIPSVDGVLAGTANHTGFFPRIELSFEGGKLVAVDGGGEYGERIRAFMDEYDDIQWPGYPDTGYFWFVEAALGTFPKAFRRSSDLFDSYWQYPNINERNRAGVFHFGFGSGDRTHTEPVTEFALEHDIPTGHLHVHNYFTTFEIKLRDTNTWHKIVDEGRMTSMDDPAMRAYAASFGDPDALLSHDWVPPIPGINLPGDYETEYAPDPAGYLRSRLERNESV